MSLCCWLTCDATDNFSWWFSSTSALIAGGDFVWDDALLSTSAPSGSQSEELELDRLSAFLFLPIIGEERKEGCSNPHPSSSVFTLDGTSSGSHSELVDPFDPIDPFLVRLDGFCSRLGDQSDEELDSDDLRLDDRSGEDDGDEVESIVFGEPCRQLRTAPACSSNREFQHDSHAVSCQWRD